MKNNNSIFGQMLQLISRYEFQKAINEYKSEKHSKGFSSWTHFVSMLFGQLSLCVKIVEASKFMEVFNYDVAVKGCNRPSGLQKTLN